MLRKNFTLVNGSEELIRGEYRYREDVRNAPAVVICHGFKGFKDWGFFPWLCERLADDGYVAFSFNFSRNGLGADLQNFTELDKFAENTYTHELSDLKTVIDSIASGELAKGIVDPENIGLMGHSRGGAIALLHAASDARINALVTWSAISTVNRYSDEQIAQWESRGYIEIENRRTGQVMQQKKVLLDDITSNSDSLNLEKACSQLDIPTLIIHGEDDESVPVQEAHSLYSWLDSIDKDLEIIEGGSHTFGIRHPMIATNQVFDTVLDLTESWLDRNLNL